MVWRFEGLPDRGEWVEDQGVGERLLSYQQRHYQEVGYSGGREG